MTTIPGHIINMVYTLHTDKSWQATMRELSDTMTKWGIKEWDTNYPKGAHLEGMRQTEEDRTIHLTYQKDGRPVKLTMDKQNPAVDNLRVLYLVVEAMHMNEKRGLGEVIQDAYRQLAGLEPAIDPYELLGVCRSRSASTPHPPSIQI
jgi:hypothetical protein